MAVKWTPQQQTAIDTRGGSLLVSAAAGSGKTAVLVQRVVERILDPVHPVDADELLVVTFSNAAAGEMRERITAKLSELSQQNPGDLRLKRQILKMEQSHISTVHAFCLDLIREQTQALDIEANFRIADENELKIMLSQCVHECVEDCYANDESGEFFALAELISSGQNDEKLIATILKLYHFVQSHPFCEDWMEEKLSYYSNPQEVCDTIWGQEILKDTISLLDYAKGISRQALAQMQEDEPLLNAYGDAFLSDIALMDTIGEQCRAKNWDEIYRTLHTVKFASLKRLTKYPDEDKKKRMQAIRNQVKKLLGDLADHQFCSTAAEVKEDIEAAYPKVKALFSAVKLLKDRMWEKKSEQRMIDFSDMEHLALQLLTRRTDAGIVQSDYARLVAQRFKEVLVDEFQDTNETQELIFRMVSRREENLFLVGDVKQSIYRFRQAMPEIFLEKKRRFHPLTPGEMPQFPAVLVLDKNFRSRKEVTDSVNFIFRQLMSMELGEMEYDRSEYLVCGASYPEAGQQRCRMALIDCSEMEEDRLKEEAEAHYIAYEIRRMVREGYPVTENGGLRPARFKDFAVLMRSPSSRSGIYIRAMQEAGVPLWADLPSGFLENREILAMVSLLRALDNPLDDISLVAAMLSELFWFDEDEISLIRLTDRRRPVYQSLLALRREPGQEKVREFMDLFDRLRTLATVLPADRLIQRIYDETGFIQSIQAQPDAQDRRENLFLLMEYAAQYEGMGYRGLWGLVRFLNELGEQGADLAPAVTFSQTADVVKLMSVHHSKGLEFPVVFLADTARRFNREDLHGTTLLQSQMGFACMGRNPLQAQQYYTVPYEAVKLRLEEGSLSEEMRILYVALTRAKETLIVTAALDNPDQKLTSIGMNLTNSPKLQPQLLRRAESSLDWLLECLMRHPDAGLLRQHGHVERDVTLPDAIRWEFAILPADFSAEQQESGLRPFCAPDPLLMDSIRREISTEYAYREATTIPSKLGVSELSERQSRAKFRFRKKPAFLKGEELSATQQGQAAHTFMQFADYHQARENVERELARLVKQQYLSPQEADTVKLSQLENFFSSDLARRMFSAKKIWREVKFLQQVKASELGYETGEETVTVQGVADCVFQEEDGAVLIDYKTDRVKDPQELVDRYTGQLRWYRRMIEESLGVPVKECRIYSLTLSMDIPVE